MKLSRKLASTGLINIAKSPIEQIYPPLVRKNYNSRIVQKAISLTIGSDGQILVILMTGPRDSIPLTKLKCTKP